MSEYWMLAQVPCGCEINMWHPKCYPTLRMITLIVLHVVGHMQGTMHERSMHASRSQQGHMACRWSRSSAVVSGLQAR